MHVCVAMILVSSKPVIFELPFSYPDLVFTREWGGNFYHRYKCDSYSDGYSYSNDDYAQAVTIGSIGYALKLCQ